MVSLQWSSRLVLVSSAAVVLAASMALPAFAEQAASAPASAVRHDMAGHFAEVKVVHEAVIRGDLPAARKAAEALAARSFAGLSKTTAPYAASIKELAGRVAAARDVNAAAASAASMLGTCGECHRTAGAMPAPELPARPSVGQAVGHMLEHQRAFDQLMQGLVVPSASLWNQGAQALRTAPLGPGQLPKDPKLTADVAAGEQRVHQLADQAAGASDTQARVAAYGTLLGTCASCHTLHANIWGPSKR